MTDRSLAVIEKEIANSYGLSEKLVQLLKLVSMPKAFRPKAVEIQARLGMSERVYFNWLRDPRFNLARRDFIKQYFQDEIADVLMAMKDEALAGNERAARLFLEYVADWDTDPDNPDKPTGSKRVSIHDVKIIIETLEQKFYGDKADPLPEATIEGTVVK